MRNGIVMVRFDNEEGKQEVLEGGIYHFDNKPVIVKAWAPEMEFSKEELLTVPIWIRLPGLDFKYWSAKGLSKIGSLVGKPLMVDKQTEKKLGLSYARMLVEVNVGQKLPEEVLFRNEKGIIISQSVTYDWKPSLCDHCKKYGHEKEECRKLKPAKEKKVEITDTSNEEKGLEKGKEKVMMNKRFGGYQKRAKQWTVPEYQPVKTTNAFEQLNKVVNQDEGVNVDKGTDTEPAPLGNG